MMIENPRERLMMLHDSMTNAIYTTTEDVPLALFIDTLIWYQEQLDKVLAQTKEVE